MANGVRLKMNMNPFILCVRAGVIILCTVHHSVLAACFPPQLEFKCV